MTHYPIFRYLAGLVLIASCGGIAAADPAGGPGCQHTYATVPGSVRTILEPFYTGTSPADELAGASARLRTLMTEANLCRVMIMTPDNDSASKQHDIMEWHSLNQWLERLTNFVGLNATGHTNVNWREEYELFAEVYELEI